MVKHMYRIKQITIFCLLLVVSNAFAQEKKSAAELESKFNKGVHVVAEVSDSKMKLSDSLTITYKLYVSQDIGISNYEVQKNLENENFGVEDIESLNKKVEYEFFKNEKYRFVILKKSVLKPKLKGKFILEALELDVTAEIPSQITDEFGRLKMQKINKTLKTDSITISVI
jgi:DNA-dependent RNA polymerase auxiliary subunit epsilon